MNERLLLQIVRIVPKNIYSRWVGRISSLRLPRRLRSPLYGWYARRYGVALDEVELGLDDYPTLHSFFTRSLKPGMRQLERLPEAILSPSDGRLAACGQLDGERLLQVKGSSYALDRLLHDPEAEAELRGGSYATIYLAPADYHRVHFPAAGRVTGFGYMPGTLFPVNELGLRNIDGLYVVNERLTTYLETARHGLVAVVMVGAMAVGRITVSYDPIETNRPGRREERRVVYTEPLQKEAGEELGVFHLGSTVLVLTQRAGMKPILPEGSQIRMGQVLLLPGDASAAS